MDKSNSRLDKEFDLIFGGTDGLFNNKETDTRQHEASSHNSIESESTFTQPEQISGLSSRHDNRLQY